MSIHISVVTQFKSKSKPFIIALHYMAHHTNLVVKIVFIQPLVVELEGMLQTTYTFIYFRQNNI
jgi:hypothetical protein